GAHRRDRVAPGFTEWQGVTGGDDCGRSRHAHDAELPPHPALPHARVLGRTRGGLPLERAVLRPPDRGSLPLLATVPPGAGLAVGEDRRAWHAAHRHHRIRTALRWDVRTFREPIAVRRMLESIFEHRHRRAEELLREINEGVESHA